MKLLHYAVVLGLICIASALGLAGTFRLTRGRIVEKERNERVQAQTKVLGSEGGASYEFDVVNPDAEEKDRVVVARDASGTVAGYAALGEAQGYGGKIRVMVGTDASGKKIIGVTVVSQKETPGLGTRIAEVKSDKSWFGMLTGKGGGEAVDQTPEFLKQFRDLSPDMVKLTGDGGEIQGLTGATISSKGTVAAVSDALARIESVIPRSE
jgi:electron transport complex protein RnfG